MMQKDAYVMWHDVTYLRVLKITINHAGKNFFLNKKPGPAWDFAHDPVYNEIPSL